MTGDCRVQFYEKMGSYSTEYLGQFFFKFGYSISYKVRLHSEHVGLLERSWKECVRERCTLLFLSKNSVEIVVRNYFVISIWSSFTIF
jgi:hypothetical protein